MAADAPPTGLIARLAEPVLAYADRLPTITGERQADLLRHAATLLDRFVSGLQRAGVPAAAVPPLRAALALIIDQRARANRAVDIATWGPDSRRLLFEGREVSSGDLAEYRRRAEGLADHAPAVAFVAQCLTRLDVKRREFDTSPVAASWGGMTAVLGVAFVLVVVGWMAWVEWRFHRDLSAAFDTRAVLLGLDRAGPFPDLATRLDGLAFEALTVAETAQSAPVGLFAGAFGFDAAARASAAYQAALQSHLPPLLAQAIDRALASEGEPAAAYDTLRAWSVLSGQSDWQAAWLAGWAADRTAGDPALAGLGPHLARLVLPAAPPPPVDAELLEQARALAAEAPEPDRAYLELRRSDPVFALQPWLADTAVPGLSVILRRKSGALMEQPMPGLYTAAGWDHARQIGAGIAVTMARGQAARLFASPLQPQNDTPDVLMDRLQDDTLARWVIYAADLRVREFTSPATSVRISGELARQSSPLEALLREIWLQAGGTDRGRTHPQQLMIAAEFGSMIQYVDEGRMTEIARLFAGLNVALAAQDREEEKGQQRLMNVQERASSVAALGVAPRVIVQLVEDTLSQTGAAHADLLSNDLTRMWQTEVLETCLAVTAGRFPFADDGADADPDQIAGLLAPGGTLDRFVQTRAAGMLDTSDTPWRWKPEARFEGLTPESAIFLQRATEIGLGLFPDGRMDATLTLSALAERGKAFFALGGNGGPVEATTDALVLAWPGPNPQTGVEVTFTSGAGEAKLASPGLWGLLRLLAPLRLRERDGGKRFLIDLKADGARLFLEMSFDRPQNPVAMRKLMQGLTCPPVL